MSTSNNTMTKSIWHHPFTLEDLRLRLHDTMAAYLGIEIIEIGADYLTAIMPLTERTRQPLGLMHGGANVVLAESVGSVAANMVVDQTKYFCVGQEINANHVRAVREGSVTAVATLDYHGKTSHVWSIKIYDDRQRLSCISRLTMAVLDRR
jgi:1,4-dihydroxy-2-naphthoyl-CoA hydrolase